MIDDLPLERIETGTYQPTLSISGDAVLYWKGYPPRLYQHSEDQWVGLFVESVEGFQVPSSELEEAKFHNNYEVALSRYEYLKRSFL